MAITLEQTNRTSNSITFSVLGIADGNDRQTYIWNVFTQAYQTFAEASSWDDNGNKNSTLIKSYSTSGGDNGTITVVFNDEYVGLNSYDNDTYWYDGDYNLKCWDFQVRELQGGMIQNIEYITTIVGFFWDNDPTKYTNTDFDMTLADHIRFQWFALYIYYWINDTSNSWSIYTDLLYGEDLREAAQKIYNTAINLTSTTLPNRSSILTDMGRILDFAYTNDKVYASHLNGIKDGINDFNLKM